MQSQLIFLIIIILITTAILSYLLGFKKIIWGLIGNLTFLILIIALYQGIEQIDQLNLLANIGIFTDPDKIEKLLLTLKPALGLILLFGNTLIFLNSIEIQIPTWIIKKTLGLVLGVPLFIASFVFNTIVVFFWWELFCTIPGESVLDIIKPWINIFLILYTIFLILMLTDFKSILPSSGIKSKNSPQPEGQGEPNHNIDQKPRFKLF